MRENAGTDSALSCPICARLLREAVRTPCCKTLYCEECIHTTLLEQDFVCPNCESKIASLDKLKPDEEARQSVEAFVKSELEKSKEANGDSTESDTDSTEKKVKEEATKEKGEPKESTVSPGQTMVSRYVSHKCNRVNQGTLAAATVSADQVEKAGTPEPGEITGDDAQAGANMAAMNGNFDMDAMNMMGMMMNPMMQYQALQMQAAQVGPMLVRHTFSRLTSFPQVNDGSAKSTITPANAHAIDDATSDAEYGDAANATYDDGRQSDDDDGRKQQSEQHEQWRQHTKRTSAGPADATDPPAPLASETASRNG